MRILVTGTTGYIGKMFLNKFKNNFEVHTLTRTTDGHINNHLYDGSLNSVIKALNTSKADLVIHFASLFIVEHKPENVNDLISSNILFGTHLLEGMRLNEVKKIINIGTSWQNFESIEYRAVNLYAATKEAFQKILDFYSDAYSFKAITLKLTDTYGPDDNRSKILNYILKYSLTGEVLGATPGNQEIDLVYIDDVLSAIEHTIHLMENSKGHQVYLISSGDPKSLKTIVEIFNSVSNKKVNIDWGQREYRNREVMKATMTSNLLPGWKPKTELRDGFKKIIK